MRTPNNRDSQVPQLSTQITIINKLGLHARAAAKFVSTAATFGSAIRVIKDGKDVDGKSIMQVMMLAAGQGTPLEVRAEGADAEAALAAISALVNNYFGEGE